MTTNYITVVDLDIGSHISAVMHSIAFENVWRDRLDNAFAPLLALGGIVVRDGKGTVRDGKGTVTGTVKTASGGHRDGMDGISVV